MCVCIGMHYKWNTNSKLNSLLKFVCEQSVVSPIFVRSSKRDISQEIQAKYV